MPHTCNLSTHEAVNLRPAWVVESNKIKQKKDRGDGSVGEGTCSQADSLISGTYMLEKTDPYNLSSDLYTHTGTSAPSPTQNKNKYM